MKFFQPYAPLLTDLYQLTMAQAYFLSNTHQKKASFDYFYRKIPFKGGYTIFAGLEDVTDTIEAYHFSDKQLGFLEKKGFNKDFLHYLAGFSFKTDIWSVQEGEVIFPLEPVLRIDGNIVECQLAETMLLNYINFQSLIATKASRINYAAQGRLLSDFGLRRAHSLGGIHASRAAIIGGFHSTSNVIAGLWYDIELSGTMGHAFIESFDNELEAFRNYAKAFPTKSIFLVDTYNTLKKGIPAAIQVAKEMEKDGHRFIGIRLDSGDLAYLSKKSRKLLDEAGLQYAKIVVSNQLDEKVIKSLLDQGAPIDIFGVGTSLVTGNPDAALDGVYKLSMAEGEPRLKISDNIAKVSLPGQKKILRFRDQENKFYADAVCLVHEGQPDIMIHPLEPTKRLLLNGYEYEEIMVKTMHQGKKCYESLSVQQIAAFSKQRLSQLPLEHQRFDYPHIYKVGLSSELHNLRNSVVASKQL